MKKFAGFGFGPIQAGLMLYEAMRSGNFGSYIIAEVDQGLVDGIRGNGGVVTINIATPTGITQANLSGITMLNPMVPREFDLLGAALKEADEIATALPSVEFYTRGAERSVACLLSAAADPAHKQLVYTCENNNYAAEVLEKGMRGYASTSQLAGVQIVNTVIGKMSGVIRDPAERERLGVAPVVPGGDRAILVEAFNRIYISKIEVLGLSCSIGVFEQKPDLLPYEEAKLFGHNAIHSLLGYLAAERGYQVMSQVRGDRELMAIGREAFLDESGGALLRKYARVGDLLFTPRGFAGYADDLLDRMTNPYLHDAVERICRDPARKLGYGDRLFGTMRLALSQGIKPTKVAQGAAAALAYLARERGDTNAALDESAIKTELAHLWQGEPDDSAMAECIALTVFAAQHKAWDGVNDRTA